MSIINIGANIQKYRNKKLLSQKELAEKCFVSRQVISNWETGVTEPRIEDIVLLCGVFEITFEELIYL